MGASYKKHRPHIKVGKDADVEEEFQIDNVTLICGLVGVHIHFYSVFCYYNVHKNMLL